MTIDSLFRGLLTVSLVCAGACAASPPLGYPSGDTWQAPLLAPIDGAELIVPVTIHDQGPYFFILRPDQQVSLIDRGVAEHLQLFTPGDSWVGLVDKSDQVVQRRPYEVLRMSLGNLNIRNVRMYSTKAGTLWQDGLPIAGVLGTDLLSRTIVLDIDRDRGVVRLVLTGHQTAPPQASCIKGRLHRGRPPIRKVVVPATLALAAGPRQIELAVDLGARHTSVWANLLPAQPTTIMLGDVRVDDLTLTRYDDRRPDSGDYDGVLGQDVLSRYRVMLDQDRRVLWLGPRAADLQSTTAERLSRWGDVFVGCQVVGCVTVRRHPERGLVAERDPQAPDIPFDVVLQPIDSAGRPLPGLLRTRVEPAAVSALTEEMRRISGQAVDYRVVDASPYTTQRRTRANGSM